MDKLIKGEQNSLPNWDEFVDEIIGRDFYNQFQEHWLWMTNACGGTTNICENPMKHELGTILLNLKEERAIKYGHLCASRYYNNSCPDLWVISVCIASYSTSPLEHERNL